ncbi:hypothetical protein D8674_040224 [Pyrus ussuriensis x Pyrus communis]|uniref:Uncharacterized protein n=1 Tax=Pyrus ussuriensis x Pyrus communis TaxID=2448454 RepID=A0A5N5I1L4_9ROSA|nr:hypothetical protein D8674_040224 [Pyrus ussuriensis x Pyrus communis]
MQTTISSKTHVCCLNSPTEQEEDDSFFSSCSPHGKNQCYTPANAMHSLRLFHSTVLVVMMQILKEKKTLENQYSFFSSHSPPSELSTSEDMECVKESSFGEEDVELV